MRTETDGYYLMKRQPMELVKILKSDGTCYALHILRGYITLYFHNFHDGGKIASAWVIGKNVLTWRNKIWKEGYPHWGFDK